MADDDGGKPIRKIDDASHGTPPENPVRRRLFRMKRWFLLDANRNLVTGLLFLGSFVTILLAGSIGPVPVQSFLTEGVSPGVALIELLKTIVSVVVIVLSINQLVLSPGLGPVDEQRERFEQSMDLRRKVETHTDVRVSPASPAAFLAALLDEIADQAAQIEKTASRADIRDSGIHGEITEFANETRTEAERVHALLSSSRFGKFEAVSAALRFAMSEKVRTLREIRQSRSESFSEPLQEALDELGDLLKLFTVAREYLKIVYIRDEYIRLSEGLLYTGLPAILITYCAAQIDGPDAFPGHFFGIENRLIFVSGAVAIALVPFAVLLSYVFRLTAMSRSTLFIGPFDARRSETHFESERDRGR
ncbi:hypothetical protein [Halopiger thermotolerans]